MASRKTADSASEAGRAPTGRERLIAAAVRALHERGYHGSSIRDIAVEAGTTSAALYHYFTGKQDLLLAMMTSIMEDALAATRAAQGDVSDPVDVRLRRLVEAWVAFHAESQAEAAVGAAELSSLEEDGRRTVIAMRDAQERMFADVIAQGVTSGAFTVARPGLAAKAIVTMGTSVASWYRPGGGRTPRQIAETYADLALAAVGFTQPSPA